MPGGGNQTPTGGSLKSAFGFGSRRKRRQAASASADDGADDAGRASSNGSVAASTPPPPRSGSSSSYRSASVKTPTRSSSTMGAAGGGLGQPARSSSFGGAKNSPATSGLASAAASASASAAATRRMSSSSSPQSASPISPAGKSAAAAATAASPPTATGNGLEAGAVAHDDSLIADALNLMGADGSAAGRTSPTRGSRGGAFCGSPTVTFAANSDGGSPQPSPNTAADHLHTHQREWSGDSDDAMASGSDSGLGRLGSGAAEAAAAQARGTTLAGICSSLRTAVGIEPTLRLTIHSAKDLLAKDLTGTSDPFVRVFIDGAKVAETSSRRLDLNPVWNQTFRIPLGKLPDPSEHAPNIRIEVLNEYYFGKVNGQISNIGKHAFLGQVLLSLCELVEKSPNIEKQWFVLEKRTAKSRVRGSILLSLSIEGVSERLPTPIPVVSEETLAARRRSHFSVSEMADMARSTSITPGFYTLHADILKCTDLPIVEIRVGVQLMVSACGNKAVTDEEYDLMPDNMDGTITMTHSPTLTVPIRTDGTSSSLVRISVIMTKAKAGGLFDVELGTASVNLSAIPVLDGEDKDEVEKLMPVDLFLEKRRMKRVPHIMKLRDGFGSVCRIRVRLWLEPRTEDDIEPSEFHLAAVDDDDDDDEGDDDGNSSAMELGGEGDDEFGSRNPPPPVNFPPVYEWELLNEVYPVSITKLNQIIFDSHSPFMDAFCNAKGYTSVTITPWSEDGKRIFSYMIPKSALMKQNFATERQEYALKEPGGYVVNVVTETLDVPYGKDLITLIQYQMSYAGHKQTRLKVTAEIKFFTTPVIKRLIQNGGKSGMSSTFQLFHRVLRPFTTRRSDSAKKGSGSPTRSVAASPGRLSGQFSAQDLGLREAEQEGLLSTAIGHLPSLRSIVLVTAFAVLVLLLMQIRRQVGALEGDLRELRRAIVSNCQDGPHTVDFVPSETTAEAAARAAMRAVLDRSQ